MKFSFVVTTFNIKGYIEQCLDSVKSCLRDGDQLIVVDDGSSDETDKVVLEKLREIAETSTVEVIPVLFGVNTIGGVGIAGNIGMDHATGDSLVFVDGDDYLDVDGFNRARDMFEKNPSDILICNYLEYDQSDYLIKPPADHRRWEKVNGLLDLESRRKLALDMIAVPWRKIYDLGFLRKHDLRFPEGDFFFEDNPFHWQVCRQASCISFADTCICFHRVNRPGQTMASKGRELGAFFTHFRTIFGAIPETAHDHRALSVLWLINNMTWHFERLDASALRRYCDEASQTLSLVPADLWDGPISEQFVDSAIWQSIDGLRRGRVWEVVESINNRSALERTSRSIDDLKREISKLFLAVQELDSEVKIGNQILAAQKLLHEFEALQNIDAGQDG